MEEKSMVSTTENVENETSTEVKAESEPTQVETPKTYTRDEVNKMLNAERTKEREAVLREVEARKVEAERLAKMDEDQKKSYEIEQANKRALTAESELNAYRLKDEAIKQASEKGVDLDLMQTLDYTKETAESITQKIEIFSNASKKIHEKAISEYSKEPTPQVGDNIRTDENKTGYEKFEENYRK